MKEGILQQIKDHIEDTLWDYLDSEPETIKDIYKDLEQFISTTIDKIREETIDEVQEVIKQAKQRHFPYDDEQSIMDLQSEIKELNQSKGE